MANIIHKQPNAIQAIRIRWSGDVFFFLPFMAVCVTYSKGFMFILGWHIRFVGQHSSYL